MKNKNLIYIQYEIKDLLAWFKALLKLNNKNNYTDINIISEAFSIKLFEEFYNTKFKILKVGNPGFDIVSKDMKFYVQITSNHNFAVKANSMLKEFDSKPGRFNGCKLILFYLGEISSAKRRRFYEKNEHQGRNVCSFVRDGWFSVGTGLYLQAGGRTPGSACDQQ